MAELLATLNRVLQYLGERLATFSRALLRWLRQLPGASWRALKYLGACLVAFALGVRYFILNFPSLSRQALKQLEEQVEALGRAVLNPGPRLRSLGLRLLKYLEELLETFGRAGLLWAGAVFVVPDLRHSLPLLVRQLHFIGVRSVVIIVLSGFSIGAVLGLQGYSQLVEYGSETSLGFGVAYVLVTQIGPVVSALLFAGRSGSALTAEIGLMKATEQLASMEMIGVDPLHRIVAPRLWAGFIAMPILAMMFSVAGVFGAYVVGVQWLGVHAGTFWSLMQEGLVFTDHVLKGIINTCVFGFIVTWIAVFEGYDAEPTAEGIARATTGTVVKSSVAILVANFFLAMVMFAG